MSGAVTPRLALSLLSYQMELVQRRFAQLQSPVAMCGAPLEDLELARTRCQAHFHLLNEVQRDVVAAHFGRAA